MNALSPLLYHLVGHSNNHDLVRSNEIALQMAEKEDPLMLRKMKEPSRFHCPRVMKGFFLIIHLYAF